MEESEYPVPHTIYNAAIALLQATQPIHSQVNLYKMALDTAEFQIIQATWDFFQLHNGITKENLEKCQATLGFKNLKEFKKCLIRNQFLTETQFDMIFQNEL